MLNYRPTFDYSKLRGRIREKFGTYDAVSRKLSYGQTTLSQKLNSKIFFSQRDILELAPVLEISDNEIPEYFFKEKVRKSEQTKQAS